MLAWISAPAEERNKTKHATKLHFKLDIDQKRAALNVGHDAGSGARKDISVWRVPSEGEDDGIFGDFFFGGKSKKNALKENPFP